MKLIPSLLLLTAYLSGCVSKPAPKIVVVPGSARSEALKSTSGIRYSERIAEYRFGRYIDPADRSTMHEAHPVYRIERPAKWDTRPNNGGARFAVTRESAVQPVVSNDAAIAEFNKQKAATRAFTEQAESLNQRLSGLAQAMNETRRVTQQGPRIEKEIDALKSRLSAIEAQKAPVPPVAKVNQAAEENW
ncbi:MAG: hypothetical protein JWL59_4859 [Chthoniobacteraceae bacterium]|nr:hypothetical protein [Chthoniobacteraceae bacterium]